MSVLENLRVSFIAGTLGQGGAERQLFYMVKALKECNAIPSVLCLTRGEFWEERIRALGVPVTWVGQSPIRSVRLARIVLALRNHPVDILQSQHFYTNLYAVAAARILGLHEVGAVRSDTFHEIHSNGPWLGKLSLRLPRAVAANSQQAICNAVKLGVKARRLFLLPNAVDTGYFRRSPKGGNGGVRLLSVARLTQQKRLDRFLTLLSRLRSSCSIPVSGLIVGEGPLRFDLEQQARKMGLLPGAVEFRGQVLEMRSIYQEADILVLTSEHEGTPNVILEAMACGLPVVATRVGGVPDIIQDGLTGFLVPKDDENAQLRVLLELVHNTDLRTRIGAAAQAYVETHHSLSQLPIWLQQLYEAVLERK